MSELARRRYQKAASSLDADPKDMLESMLQDLRELDPEEQRKQHYIIIRATKDDDARTFDFTLDSAGPFNVLERQGLMQIVMNRIALVSADD